MMTLTLYSRKHGIRTKTRVHPDTMRLTTPQFNKLKNKLRGDIGIIQDDSGTSYDISLIDDRGCTLERKPQ